MPTPALPALQCSVAPEKSSASRALKPLLAGSLALLLAACGGGGGQLGTMDPDKLPTPPPPPESLYRVGTGAGTGFQEGSINASHTTLRAGESALLRVNVIDANGNPVVAGGASVTFSSPCIATGLSTISAPAETTDGLFSATYVNLNCAGTDTVTVRLPNNSRTATVTLNVSTAQPLTVSHVSTTNEQLVLGGLGGLETSEVVFNVAGPQGAAIVGQSIDFGITSSVGKATILPGWETGLTDQEGNVRTIIKSGTTAGPVTVVAEHKATGIKGLSADIIISTGVPAGNRFSMSYKPFNPPNAYYRDGEEVEIEIIATDMFGNAPMDGTRVSFISPEAGKVDDFCLLEDGRCTVIWTSARANPHPADNRVEVLAYTEGAEGFTDMNGNSIFDVGDSLVGYDLTEPYADEDENGKYDLGEFFFDTNSNGVWDVGDGIWNGPCLEQIHSNAICPSLNKRTVTIFNSVTIVMSTNVPKILSLGTGPTATRFPNPGNTIYTQQGRSKSLAGLVIGDNFDNPLPAGTTVSFRIDGGGVSIQGLTDFTIDNTTSAWTDVFGVTLAAAAVEIPLPIVLDPSCTDNDPDTLPNPGMAECAQPQPELPKDVYLVLKVTPPPGPSSVEVTYSWPIDVQI